MSDTPISPLDELLPVLIKAVTDWKSKNTPEDVTKKVTKLLNQNSEEIIYKLLGFNKDRWSGGTWELDHCNGRSGESAAGDYLRKVKQDAVEEWLRSIPIPTIPASMLKDFKKTFQIEFNRRVEYQLSQLIDKEADKQVNELFKTITSSDHLDKYFKAMALIAPTEGT